MSEEIANAMAHFVPALSQLIEEHSQEQSKPDGQAQKLDAVSFEQYCVDTLKLPVVVDLMNQISRALLGVEANEVSMLFMVDYIRSATGLVNIISDKKDGGQYKRCKTGKQIPSNAYGAVNFD